jgi:anti-sigma B factor antagonist
MAELEGTQPAQLKIVSEDGGEGIAVISVCGQLDISNAGRLERALAEAAKARPRSLVFDLSGLEFMDSAGISVLVRARAEVGEVRLRKPTAIVRRLIEITGRSEILPIEP